MDEPTLQEPTLQETIREKYQIDDELLVEGRFVALLGNTNDAISLVCLGLSRACLFTAEVVLSGDEIDYELISITPLSLVELTFTNRLCKVKVRSEFKATQVFQLCSNIHFAEIWDKFTTCLRNLDNAHHGHGDIVRPETSIKPMSTDTLADSQSDMQAILMLQELYPSQCMQPYRFASAKRSLYDTSIPKSSASLPTILPSMISGDYATSSRHFYCGRHSLQCIGLSPISRALIDRNESDFTSISLTSADDSFILTNGGKIDDTKAITYSAHGPGSTWPRKSNFGTAIIKREKKSIFRRMRSLFSCCINGKT